MSKLGDTPPRDRNRKRSLRGSTASLVSTVSSRLTRRDSGQAQVEFVLSILFVALLIFSVFELTMLVYTYDVLADSAKEGVRYGVVHGSLSANATSSSGTNTCSTGSLPPVYQQVCNFASASFHNVSGMSVTVSYPDGTSGSTTNPPNAPPNRLQVQVSYPYKPLLGLNWEATTVSISAASEGRIDF